MYSVKIASIIDQFGSGGDFSEEAVRKLTKVVKRWVKEFGFVFLVKFFLEGTLIHLLCVGQIGIGNQIEHLCGYDKDLDLDLELGVERKT